MSYVDTPRHATPRTHRHKYTIVRHGRLSRLMRHTHCYYYAAASASAPQYPRQAVATPGTAGRVTRTPVTAGHVGYAEEDEGGVPSGPRRQVTQGDSANGCGVCGVIVCAVGRQRKRLPRDCLLRLRKRLLHLNSALRNP